MTRRPAVAGRFYDNEPFRLRQSLAALIPALKDKITAGAVICPHAGYIYSGGVAGATFARITIPETVILLGPTHQGINVPLAVSTEDWDMPLGRVASATDLAATLTDRSDLFMVDNAAHQQEHSLEVQLPFLQYFQDNLRIVPVVVAGISFAQCRQAAAELAAAIRRSAEPVLLVASTDMSHYLSRRLASAEDHLALDHIMQLDPAGLYSTVLSRQISMCGIMPTTVALLAAMELGAGRAELVRYTDSGEVSGETDRVVGYAGVVVY